MTWRVVSSSTRCGLRLSGPASRSSPLGVHAPIGTHQPVQSLPVALHVEADDLGVFHLRLAAMRTHRPPLHVSNDPKFEVRIAYRVMRHAQAAGRAHRGRHVGGQGPGQAAGSPMGIVMCAVASLVVSRELTVAACAATRRPRQRRRSPRLRTSARIAPAHRAGCGRLRTVQGTKVLGRGAGWLCHSRRSRRGLRVTREIRRDGPERLE